MISSFLSPIGPSFDYRRCRRRALCSVAIDRSARIQRRVSNSLSLSLLSLQVFKCVHTAKASERERERRSGSYMYNIPGSIRLIKPLWPSLFPFLLFFFSPTAIPNGDVLRRRRRLLYGEKSTTFGRSGAWDGGKQ